MEIVRGDDLHNLSIKKEKVEDAVSDDKVSQGSDKLTIVLDAWSRWKDRDRAFKDIHVLPCFSLFKTEGKKGVLFIPIIPIIFPVQVMVVYVYGLPLPKGEMFVMGKYYCILIIFLLFLRVICLSVVESVFLVR